METILIVEDEPVVALDLMQTLEGMGHAVCDICADRAAALAAVSRSSPTLVMMDINLGHGQPDGVAIGEHLYREWQLPVIFLTAYADDATLRRAIRASPFGYLTKPYSVRELNAAIQVARNRHDMEQALSKSEKRLAMAIEAAELGTWEWESCVDSIVGDERFERIWGGRLHPFAAGLQAMLDRIHPDDRAGFRALLTEPGVFKTEFRAVRDGGMTAWVEVFGNLRIRSDGHRIVIGAMRDITLRKQVEYRLNQANVIFNAMSEGVLILDADGRVVNANPAFYRMTGYAAEAVRGRKLAELLDAGGEQPDYGALAADPDHAWCGELSCKARDGTVIPTFQHVCMVKDPESGAMQFIQTISDITAIREAEAQLAHLAMHDPLTGLGNRYQLVRQLERALERCRMLHDGLHVLFIDLDGFKAVNDTMGHHVGDAILQQVAGCIAQTVRRHDEAVRLGGDEFVVLLPDVAERRQAVQIANKLLAAIGQPMVVEGQPYILSASIGLAGFPADGQSMAELLSAADSAMYEAKHQGKNRVQEYAPDLTIRARTRLGIGQRLHGVIERNELRLHYQPVVGLDDMKLLGFEALLRWQHPEEGLLMPDAFIGLCEEGGLMDDIGAWVMRTALQQLQAWNRQYGSALFMAVNVSPLQFRRADYPEEVRRMLAETGVPPALLDIEITESTLHDFAHSRRIVEALRRQGISVSIDDFGTGYSSLSLLKHLPITRIKVDRSFLVSVPDVARDVGLLSGILQMAASLQLEVTAEGVETPAQVGLLQVMGRPAVQGYHFCRPGPAGFFDADWFAGHLRAWPSA